MLRQLFRVKAMKDRNRQREATRLGKTHYWIKHRSYLRPQVWPLLQIRIREHLLLITAINSILGKATRLQLGPKREKVRAHLLTTKRQCLIWLVYYLKVFLAQILVTFKFQCHNRLCQIRIRTSNYKVSCLWIWETLKWSWLDLTDCLLKILQVRIINARISFTVISEIITSSTLICNF